MSAGGSLGAPKDAPPAGSQGELLHVCLQSSKIQRPQGLLEQCEHILLLLLSAGTSSGVTSQYLSVYVQKGRFLANA